MTEGLTESSRSDQNSLLHSCLPANNASNLWYVPRMSVTGTSGAVGVL